MRIVSKIRFIIFFTVLILIVLSLSAGFYFIYQVKIPLDRQGAEQVFTIVKGEGAEEISASLEKVDLIRNRFWFNTYIYLKGLSTHLQAGEYDLSPSLNVEQIAYKLAGGSANVQEVTITIPEGFDLRKIDARLAKHGLIETDELLADSRKLEGYLFPDTYRFNKDATLDQVIEKMTDNFDLKVNQDLKDEIQRQGKTLDQIIILASLIEKEVATEQDRKIVSGIFWNRLAINYPLQSCATIAYILNIDKWIYSIEDTKIASPYNTYQNVGLPPGPIANPGLLAIRAAIYPQDTDYLFFLSKPDGETVFSKTLEEHNENKERYLR